MGYRESVNAFASSLAENFAYAFAQMESAVASCPDGLWGVDLWPDEAPTTTREDGGLVGSAPWLLAHHALICLDYDLSAEFVEWHEPPPFDESVWAIFPKRVFTKTELLGYVDYCRSRTAEALTDFTEDLAQRPLPETHRHRGKTYGNLVGSLAPHTVEHAAQIRQFVRSSVR